MQPINYSSFGNNPYASQKREDNSTMQAISAAGLGVASFGLQQASEYLGKKLMQGEEFTSPENVCKVASGMLSDNKLNDKVEVRFLDNQNVDTFISRFGQQWEGSLRTVAEGKNAFYADRLNIAVAPKSKPSLILHELGHAINDHKKGFMHLLQKTRGVSAYAPTALLALAPFFQSKKDDHNVIKDNAGLIGFAAFLPTIIEEGMASFRGVKAAGEKLGKSANLKALKRNYAFAWGTYVLAGIGLGLSAKMAFLQGDNQ